MSKIVKTSIKLLIGSIKLIIIGYYYLYSLFFKRIEEYEEIERKNVLTPCNQRFFK